jgi:hypothetical protein
MKESEELDMDINFNRNEIRKAVQDEYAAVALKPERGFHFHIGRKLLNMMDYEEDWLE